MPVKTNELFKATSFPNLWRLTAYSFPRFISLELGKEQTPLLPVLHLPPHQNLTQLYISMLASSPLQDAPLSHSSKAACTLPFRGARGGSEWASD